MTNFNGNILEDNTKLSIKNRGYAYGDALFETIKVSNGKVLFMEDHYFRLMASMRIMRMEIPMNFTLEFLESQILTTLKENNLQQESARVKLIVHRNEGGYYLPLQNSVGFNISVSYLENSVYDGNEASYEVDLFKDYYIAPTLLSTLKSNNRAINVIGSIYAKENELDNCFLLNTDKKVVEALNGNVFVLKDNVVKTPPLSDGCLKGVMRTQIIDIINQFPDISIEESSISPFELQKADEIFITNTITGIQSVSKYRKKIYDNSIAKALLEKLNIKVRLV